jgi:RimJ/RimL family protein N-acetyltransferase
MLISAPSKISKISQTPFKPIIRFFLSSQLEKKRSKIPSSVLDDFETHLGLWSDLPTKFWETYFSKECYLVLMIDSHQLSPRLLGTASLFYIPNSHAHTLNLPSPNTRTYELRDVFVLPPFRGQGLAGKMMEDIVQWGRRSNRFSRLKLDVWRSNLPAIRCYEKCGFQKLSSRHPATKWINIPHNLFNMYGIQKNDFPIPNDTVDVYFLTV